MRRYVLISNHKKDIEYQYADFGKEENMSICFFKFNRLRIGVLKLLDRLHISDCNIVRNVYFHRIFKREIGKVISGECNEEVVFIVMAGAYEKYRKNLVRYLRKNFKNCQLVLYLADLVPTMRFSLKDAKIDFDLVSTFDKREAEINELKFVLEPFSSRCLDKEKWQYEQEYDITFVGHVKNRYDEIIKIYEELKKRNLKCDFHLIGVKKKQRKYKEDIHYGWLDFEDVLIHVNQSKCVLEILQKGEYSATTRYSEAMLLGRNLLTNCQALNEPENQESNIFYFERVDNIPFDKLTKIQEFDRKKYIDMFSIESFVSTINNYLKEVKKDD